MRISHTAKHIIQEGTEFITSYIRGEEALYETITEHTELIMKLAGSAANVELDLGGLSTVKTIWISADQNITIKLALNTNYAIDVKANFPFALVMATGVTAIFISNSTATEATVTVILGG